MAAVIEHKKFVFTNAGINSNKVWEVKLFDNDDVEVLYGRIGKGLQSKVHPGAGRKKMDSLIRDKTRPSEHYNGGCYREIEVLDAGSAAPGKAPAIAAKTELKEIAKQQIATCKLTQKLIEFFTEVNAHDIYKATGGRITYDVSAGTFKTPVGIVTRANVDSARAILDEIADFINAGRFDAKFIARLEDYLMLIPQDVGRKFEPRSFCGDVAAVQRQSQILDGLDASIQAVLSSPKDKDKKTASVEPPKLFNVRLGVVDDKSVLDDIMKFFNKGRHSNHVSAGMRLRTAYAIDMPYMQTAWDKDGAKMQNIWPLWHGTKASNCLSILKTGYVIPPATASHCCGRAFGNGVYFSDQSTKSLNYATNYWGGRDEGRYFMFYNKVAMGKFFVPSRTFDGGCPKGHDSTFCQAGRVFQNNEMIVYRTSQILPVYLIEFGK